MSGDISGLKAHVIFSVTHCLPLVSEGSLRKKFILFNLFISFKIVFPFNTAGAQILPLLDVKPEAFYDHSSPNEWNPQDAIPILNQSPPGVYLSVGSERGFIGAALARSSLLLLTDYNENVVGFNRINIGLLAVSTSLEDYRYLRLRADDNEWQRRARQSTLPSSIVGSLLRFESWETWDFWVRSVNIRNWRQFHEDPSRQSSTEDPFHGANYLWNIDQYEHLAALARAGKIEAHKLDLGNSKERGALVQAVREVGYELAVVDLSNAWHPQYLKRDELELLMKDLEKIVKPNTILLITNNASLKSRLQYLKGQASLWDYFGFTFEYLKNTYGSWSNFWATTLDLYNSSWKVPGEAGFLLPDAKNSCTNLIRGFN